MSYDEHLISMAGGDGGCHECSYPDPHGHGFICNDDCAECSKWLEKERQPPANDTEEEAEALARAILTRRRRKCIAEGAHTEDCQRCGL